MSRSLTGMLLGRALVGIGLGVGPPVASLYVTEVEILCSIFSFLECRFDLIYLRFYYVYLFVFFRVDITCTCEGYVWELYSDSNLSWTDGCSIGWNSSKEYFWMVNRS